MSKNKFNEPNILYQKVNGHEYYVVAKTINRKSFRKYFKTLEDAIAFRDNNFIEVEKIVDKQKEDRKNISFAKLLKSAAMSMGDDLVYFVTDGKYVKIGYSSNFNERLKDLQTSNSSELKICYLLKSSQAKHLERFMHEIFETKRVSGEWFDILDLFPNWNKTDVL